MNILSIKEMKSLEEEAFNAGITYAEMINSAGNNLGDWINRSFIEDSKRSTVGLLGSGKNGADTIIALVHLLKHGWQCSIYFVKPRPEGEIYLREFLSLGGSVIRDIHQLDSILAYQALILDGILGTGYHPPMENSLKYSLDEIIMAIDSQLIHPRIIAVDCPSGIDCDSGDVNSPVIRADTTACMGAVKAGLLSFPALDYCGQFQLINIGLPKNVQDRESSRFVVDELFLKNNLPYRSSNTHKGTFGKTAMMVGSDNYPGAAFLAGKSAYLSGTGLVTILSTHNVQSQVAGQLPEATWLNSTTNTNLFEKLEEYSSLLVGPGLGLDEDAHRRFSQIFNAQNNYFSDYEGITIFDADGLRILTEVPNWYENFPEHVILTPHPGEMAFMTGLTNEEVQTDRWNLVMHFAEKWQKIIVLKGAVTVIAEPGGKLGVIPFATSALATAGTGDVLAGLIAGLIAQGIDSFKACLLGAYIHGKAGKLAEQVYSQTYSITAVDILRIIPKVFN